MPTVLNQGCCEEMLSRLYKNLNKSMKKAIPKSKPKLADRNNLWWNDKLKQLRKQLGKAINPIKNCLVRRKALFAGTGKRYTKGM